MEAVGGVVDGRTGPVHEAAGSPARDRAFAELYGANHAALVRLAFLLTGSAEVAQDVVQEAFVGLHRRWQTVHDPVSYVRRSVVNATHSHHRRAARARSKEVVGGDPERALSLVPARADEPDELSDTLAALPDRQRSAIVLRFYVDLPDAAIAEILGCRVGTVASLVHRGLAALREVVEP